MKKSIRLHLSLCTSKTQQSAEFARVAVTEGVYFSMPLYYQADSIDRVPVSSEE